MIRSTSIELAKVAYRYAKGTGYDVRLVAMTVLAATWIVCSILIYLLSWVRYVAGGGLLVVPALSYAAARSRNDDSSLVKTMETIRHQIDRPDHCTTRRLQLEASHEEALQMLEADVVLD